MTDEITPKEIKRLMLRNYKRYTTGEISDTQAYKENTILANILKAIEASETEERLRAIEAALRSQQNNDYEDEED
jgi:hypothetical protein